jgi:hypothetical protein
MSSPSLDVDALLDDPAIRIVVCCGSGGVGKTTMAAAVALGLAERGLKVAVVTIDPAKRLATALGLDTLGNEPHRVELEAEGELCRRWTSAVLSATCPRSGLRARPFAGPLTLPEFLSDQLKEDAACRFSSAITMSIKPSRR